MESAPRPSNTPSILQLILGLLTFGTSIIGALALAIIGSASGQLDLGSNKTVQYAAWLCFAFGVPAIPSIVYAIRRLSGHEEKAQTRKGTILSASVAMALLIIPAWLVTLPAFTPAPAWFMAIANILFIAVPAWWVVELGSFRLPPINRQKQWGLFNFATFISIPVIVAIEGLLLILGAVFLYLWLSQTPEYVALVDSLKNLMYVNTDALPLIIDQFASLLQSPGIIAVIFFGIALAIPLIEELLKPLALWFFVRRQWTPAQGFVTGMISGAAFSIVESLTAMAAVGGDSWLALAGARAATTLLHITTAGLSGWALTSTWRDGKIRRVGLTYLLVVFIHGTWNACAIAVGISQMTNVLPVPVPSAWASVAMGVMAALVVLLVLLLFLVNRTLRRQDPALPPPPLVPPLPQQSAE